MRVQACRWQGQVFAPGDFLAIWAVENVVHQLDLLVAELPPRSGLALARATIEAIGNGEISGEVEVQCDVAAADHVDSQGWVHRALFR